MKDVEKKTVYYTIERTFLNQISARELLSRIILSHIAQSCMEKENSKKGSDT